MTKRRRRDLLLTSSGGSSYLDGQLSSTCYESIAKQYSGSGDFLNVVESPPQGAQSSYDWTVETGMTHNDAGDASYFQTNGSGFFALSSITSTVMAKAHRTDFAGVWFALFMRASSTPAGADRLFGNSINGLELGCRLQMASDEKFDQYVTDGVSSVQPFANIGFATSNLDIGLVLSWDPSGTTSNTYSAFNTTTGTTGSTTFTTNTTDNADTWELFRIDSNGMSAGWRLYGVAGGNELLDDTKCATIFSYFETETGVDFTP